MKTEASKVATIRKFDNLEDVKSPVVRRAYLRGSFNLGKDHGRQGLPITKNSDNGILDRAWLDGYCKGTKQRRMAGEAKCTDGFETREPIKHANPT